MLEGGLVSTYYAGMTKTYILPTLVLATLIAAPAFAEDVLPAPAPLYFSAVNAGYKDNDSAQNADFIELTKTTSEPLPLADYHIRYFNSSDKQAGELAYDDTMYLEGDKLVLGYKNNPQFADAPAEYLYTFSSSGLASTGGRLQLLEDENVIDEICWGKVTCERQLPKFATDAEQNQTALRCEDECEAEFDYDKYYPEPDFEAITIVLPEDPEELEESSASAEEAVAPVSCKGLIFTELLSYSDDQFIELLNTSSETIDATGCQIRFKKKYYPLDAQIKPSAYYVVDDVPLTKNPSSSLTLELLDDNGTVDEISYAKGQKTGVAMALVDGK